VCALSGTQAFLQVDTPGRGLHDITSRVAAAVRRSGVQTGLCHLFLQHTSASLVVQENADEDVRRDLLDWLERLAPDGDRRYRHTAEGPDDMSAHLRAAVTATSLAVPVADGALALGRWQAVYLCEHRTSPHRRTVVVTVVEVRSESDRATG
jgi:secondary thiamine-phosphate synthase enzyme